jgi:DNA-binding NarL/FixJ family response regulator
MNEWMILAALIVALVLCALGVSVYALLHAHRASAQSAAVADAAREECSAAVEAVRSKFEGMAAELQAASRRPAIEPLPGIPKSSMNLSRRSQALRLRRNGESPHRIAETLEMARQEVDLLIKVHDIVLRSV